MHRILVVVLIALCFLLGCKKSGTSSPPSASSANSNDPVAKKLTEIAGSDATNCGRLQTQGSAEMSAASKCATAAAQEKRPFYVAYDMPGMTVAVAGNAEGKLFTIQSQTGGVGLASSPCPAELRIAPSGRVTCYAPGTFPMGAGMGSHGGTSVPPATGPNPHQGSKTPANPHQN
jgi:hypothetical protein